MDALSLYDILGLLGVGLLLLGYGLTVAGKADPQHAPALLLNLAGALLILLSLTKDFNLPAAVIEIAWATIACAGLVRRWLRRD